MGEHVELIGGRVMIFDDAGHLRAVVSDQGVGPVVLLYHDDGSVAGAVSFSPGDDDLCVLLAADDGGYRTGLKLYNGEAMVFTFDCEGRPAGAYRVEDPPPRRPDVRVSRN